LTYAEISSILHLKPSEMNSFYSIPSPPLPLPNSEDQSYTPPPSTVASLTNTLSYHPVIPLDLLMNSSQLQNLLSSYSESLLMDSIFIQSIFGYSITPPHTEHNDNDNDGALNHVATQQTCQILQQILDHGVTYVISSSQPSSKLIILFPMQRSMIFLQSISHDKTTLIASPSQNIHSDQRVHEISRKIIPLAFQKRMKDFPRIFRNKLQERRLSFRINSNFDHTVQALIDYHDHTSPEEIRDGTTSPPSSTSSTCWINSDLVKIWKSLLNQKKFFIFELWSTSHGEGGDGHRGNDVLLAADFAHLSNRGHGVYVATRYHNNETEYKSFQSGYLLASLSCQYLQQRGYVVWDLGGVDMCPLMKYKNDVTGKPYHRAEAFYLLKKVQEWRDDEGRVESEGEGERRVIQEIESGVVIEHVCLEDTMWR
jgi:hypothetical protein